LDEYSASGLPDQIEPKAVDRLILLTLENWPHPLENLLKSLDTILRKALTATLRETTHKWSTTILPREINRICQQEFLDAHIGDLRDNSATRALRLEQRKPITEDERTMKRYEEEELEVFQAARFKARTEAYFDQQDRVTGKESSPEERARKRRTDLDGLKTKIGPDPYDREVKVMSRIRAYYQIASIRFVDHIRQSVEAELFDKFRNGLYEDLAEGLGVTQADCKFSCQDVFQQKLNTHSLGHDHCSKLLEDDEARGERRIALKDKKVRLERAHARLQALLHNPMLYDQQSL
jgi:hypothetical protein